MLYINFILNNEGITYLPHNLNLKVVIKTIKITVHFLYIYLILKKIIYIHIEIFNL